MSETRRTKIKDLPVAEQEMTEEELQKVKGGVGATHKYELLPAENNVLKKMDATDTSTIKVPK